MFTKWAQGAITSWQHHEVIFTASNVTNPNGRLRIQFIGLDDFYFDNVSLVEVTAATSLDLSPYFEEFNSSHENMAEIEVQESEAAVSAASTSAEVVTVTKYDYPRLAQGRLSAASALPWLGRETSATRNGPYMAVRT